MTSKTEIISLIEKFNQLNKRREYELNIQIDREFYFWRNLSRNLPK